MMQAFFSRISHIEASKISFMGIRFRFCVACLGGVSNLGLLTRKLFILE